MAFHVITSDDNHSLAASLAAELAKPTMGLDPFAIETVVVQNPSILKWLQFQLAKNNSICAGIDFLFPNNLIEKIFKKNNVPSTLHIFDRNSALWKIYNHLISLVQKPTAPITAFDHEINFDKYSELVSYIEAGNEESRETRVFQLAGRLADLFDQYSVYRREIVYKWNNDELHFTNPPRKEELWQKELWCDLFATETKGSASTPEAVTSTFTELPTRIFVFGVSILPPIHFQYLTAFSKKTDVYFYLFSPLQSGLPSGEVGKNPLTHHLFKSGLEFLNMLGPEGVHTQLPSSEHSDSTLRRLQLSIRSDSEKGPIAPEGDDSISVVSCYGARREIEVLHDKLLYYIECGFKPSDILVLAPDITAYAPHIEAVFSTAPEKLNIPFRIVGKQFGGSNNNISASLLKILKLLESRFEFQTLFEPLECEALREMFQFAEEDSEKLTDIFERNHIYWGIDSLHEKSFGLPPLGLTTWQSGFQKIALGFLMKPTDIFSGETESSQTTEIVPTSAINNETYALVSKFYTYFELLTQNSEMRLQDKTPAEWLSWLENLLTIFFRENFKTALEWLSAKQAINSLRTALPEGDTTISYKVFLLWIAPAFENTSSSQGLLSGGVTFGTFESMKGVPSPIVALLGMNDGDFPGKNRSAAFDLQIYEYKKCDRRKREGDQTLFLETIFSASQKLYLSFSGKNLKDNSTLYPSVTLSALIDFVTDLKIEEHPLQSFSKKYFTKGSHLFSYHNENLIHAALSSCENLDSSSAPLYSKFKFAPPYDPKFYEITPRDLSHFLTKPSAYFFKNILSIDFPELEEAATTTEPFEANRLDEYTLTEKLNQKMLFKKSDQKNRDSLYKTFYLSGGLPYGLPGKKWFETLFEQSLNTVTNAEELIGEATETKEFVHLTIPLRHHTLTLSGNVANLYENKLVYVLNSSLKIKHLISAAIDQLLLASQGKPVPIFFVSSEETKKIEAPSLPKELLIAEATKRIKQISRLLEISFSEPLPFFPEGSYQYFHELSSIFSSYEIPLEIPTLEGIPFPTGFFDELTQKLDKDAFENTLREKLNDGYDSAAKKLLDRYPFLTHSTMTDSIPTSETHQLTLFERSSITVFKSLAFVFNSVTLQKGKVTICEE